jgi:putative oxidoreductase
MTELKLAVESRRGVADILMVWIPRLALAALFLNIGAAKFASDGLWVRIFAKIGFGQWFRYLTGAMQAGGALLLLVPRTVVAGAALIGCTLVGAVIVQIAIFHSISAVIPAVLLLPVAFVGLHAAFSD